MEHSLIQAAAIACPIVTIERETLLPALDYLARYIIERRNTVPILSNVLIAATSDGMAQLTGNNLDIEATFTIAAQWDVPGAFTLDAVTLRDLVKKADKGAHISLRYDDGRVALSYGRIAQSLPALPVDDFPHIVRSDLPLSWELDAQELASDIAMIQPAICKEETRYYLRGIFVHALGDGSLRMAATNGHALSMVKRPAPIAAMEMQGAIVPDAVIKAMSVALKGNDRASLAFSSSKVEFCTGNLRLYAKLIDGTFPDYARVIPDANFLTGTLSVESAELMAHCKTAGQTGANARQRYLTVELSEGGSRAGQSGKSPHARALSAEYMGNECRVAFDAQYLEPMAKGVDRLDIQGGCFDTDESGCPMLFTSPDAPHWTGVLMPVRDEGYLPEAVAVRYVETLPARGRACDLFGIEKAANAGSGTCYGKTTLIGIAPGPRKATSAELEAYARNYAARLGIDTNGFEMTIAKLDKDDRCVAVNFDNGAVEGCEQSVTVLLPGYGQDSQPVTVELLGDDGQYSEPMTCSDAKGKIAMPDQPKGRAAPKPRKHRLTKREKVWQEMGKVLAARRAAEIEAEDQTAPVADPIAEPAPDAPLSGECKTWHCSKCGSDAHRDATAPMPENCWKPDCDGFLFYVKRASQSAADSITDTASATYPASESEIAPQQAEIAVADEVEGEPDPVVTLIARMDALEAMLIAATTKEAAEINSHPIAAIADEPTLSAQSMPKRTPAHVRAIMAYLAMRKARRWSKAYRADAKREYETLEARFNYHMEMDRKTTLRLCSEVESLNGKRRRAVLSARVRSKAAWELGRALLVEHEAKNALAHELAKLKQSLADPFNPARESDMVLLKDNAAKWQARATAAIEEGERLKNLALRNGGHIENLATRLARAEAILREQGALPVLTLVPPSVSVAA